MMVSSEVANTLPSSDELIEEQLSFSTADVERIIFSGETKEFYGVISQHERQPQKFRLIDGNLLPIIEGQLQPGAQPLTRDAGIFRIIGLGRGQASAE